MSKQFKEATVQDVKEFLLYPEQVALSVFYVPEFDSWVATSEYCQSEDCSLEVAVMDCLKMHALNGAMIQSQKQRLAHYRSRYEDACVKQEAADPQSLEWERFDAIKGTYKHLLYKANEFNQPDQWSRHYRAQLKDASRRQEETSPQSIVWERYKAIKGVYKHLLAKS